MLRKWGTSVCQQFLIWRAGWRRVKISLCVYASVYVSGFLFSSQLLAEFTRLPLPGLEGSLGVHQLVQLSADAGHVELGGLALLSEGGGLHPQLSGGHGELLAALSALQLHSLGIAEKGLHAHSHWLPLFLRHNLDREREDVPSKVHTSPQRKAHIPWLSWLGSQDTHFADWPQRESSSSAKLLTATKNCLQEQGHGFWKGKLSVKCCSRMSLMP